MQLYFVLDVTYLPAKCCAGLEDLVHPEVVIGALNYFMDLASINPMLTLTETCGLNDHHQKAEEVENATSGEKNVLK